jgi:hypothetical protein
MESTGLPNKIQISKDTATFVQEAGKSNWLIARKELVDAKGKGIMQTYWLSVVEEKDKRRSSQVSRNSMSSLLGDDNLDGHKLKRLVDWNVVELLTILQRIVARRQLTMMPDNELSTLQSDDSTVAAWTRPSMIMEEVKEVVTLPKFDPNLPCHTPEAAMIKVPAIVKGELRDFVMKIAAGYRDNPFHNFEHASHVCLSANKLLRRIVHSDGIDYRLDSNENVPSKIRAVAADLHNHTYGISSDSLTHFAVVFSALIHDVGHTGGMYEMLEILMVIVRFIARMSNLRCDLSRLLSYFLLVPNGQLATEHPEIAAKYKEQSIAEQRSVDMAWELLEGPSYDNLRKCIFSTEEERTLFRSLLVNSVIATDIFDKQLTVNRKARWKKAFQMEDSIEKSPGSFDEEDTNRKATIVIEHIIQASDVAHTMQHWHIYLRWNSRLFEEMYKAYRSGRGAKDPSEGWYKGELWFFDNYVIPLAHKLKDCGVFGVSSDEYLNYAMANREEWERKGMDIVAKLAADLDEATKNSIN